MAVKTAPSTILAGAVEIYFYADLRRSDAIDYVAAIKAAGDSPILLRINCDGGSIFAGYAICTALRAHKPGVTAQIDGVAASTASWIALAAQSVRASSSSYFIIHNPQTDAEGEADDLRSAADQLDKIKADIVSTYCAKTGLTPEQVSAMMDEETWLDANQALAFGFVDEIIDSIFEPEMCLHFDTTRFRKTPQNLLHPMKKLRSDIINRLSTLAVNIKEEDSDEALHQALMAKLDELVAYRDRLAAINTEVSKNYQSIDDLYNEMSGLYTQHEASEKELADLKKLYDSAVSTGTEATEKAAGLATEITNKVTELSQVQNRVTDLQNQLTAAGENTARLEQLCGLKGIDPKNAVPHVDEPAVRKTRAEFENELRATKDPAARAQIAASFENALKTGAIARN
jgi:ATP-dependent Clp endopeptidase proteolytic subunit ClpP